jgi:outer membrane lipoprotein-sorting protein
MKYVVRNKKGNNMKITTILLAIIIATLLMGCSTNKPMTPEQIKERQDKFEMLWATTNSTMGI